MTSITASDRPLRILYLGTPCELSRAPLLAVLDAGIEVCGVVVPTERGAAPIARLAPPPSRSPLPIAGRYVVESVIGHGGQGVVYRARDSKGGRDVAIKVLSLLAARDPQAAERFLREYVPTWSVWNHVRGATAFLAAVFLILALLTVSGCSGRLQPIAPPL